MEINLSDLLQSFFLFLTNHFQILPFKKLYNIKTTELMLLSPNMTEGHQIARKESPQQDKSYETFF